MKYKTGDWIVIRSKNHKIIFEVLAVINDEYKLIYHQDTQLPYMNGYITQWSKTPVEVKSKLLTQEEILTCKMESL